MADLVAFSRAWRQSFGTPPNDYFCWDIETTGFDAKRDYILQIGWLQVRGGVALPPRSLVIDWTRVLDAHALVDLRQRVSRVCREMYGTNCPWSLDRLHAEGVVPKTALDIFVNEVLGPGPILVGHNVWQFDLPRIEEFAVNTCGRPIGLPMTKMIDTAAMVKSMQSGSYPAVGDNYRGYTVRAVRAGGGKYKYNLSDYCVDRFALIRRYGVNPLKCHDAAYDVLINHYVYQDLRNLIVTEQFAPDIVETPWGPV